MPSGAFVSSHTHQITNSCLCQNMQEFWSLCMTTCTVSQAPNHVTASSFAGSEQIQKPSGTFPKSYGIMLTWNFETWAAWVAFNLCLPLKLIFYFLNERIHLWNCNHSSFSWHFPYDWQHRFCTESLHDDICGRRRFECIKHRWLTFQLWPGFEIAPNFEWLIQISCYCL